jgi:hypothetical protein
MVLIVTPSNTFTPTKQIKITVACLEKTIDQWKERYQRLQVGFFLKKLIF